MVNRIRTPKGGKIHKLTVDVDESIPWRDAINSLFEFKSKSKPPNAALEVSAIGDKKYPALKISGQRTVILVAFGDGFPPTSRILEWVKNNNLRYTTPRTIFSIARQHNNLCDTLRMDKMGIVSLMACDIDGQQRVCDIWWRRHENKIIREPYLNWLYRNWDPYYWFAFIDK
ncbi:MAG: hypothetical protein Q8Q37_02545 [bacterium]|nr:hypothetical protein [bacterium]